MCEGCEDSLQTSHGLEPLFFGRVVGLYPTTVIQEFESPPLNRGGSCLGSLIVVSQIRGFHFPQPWPLDSASEGTTFDLSRAAPWGFTWNWETVKIAGFPRFLELREGATGDLGFYVPFGWEGFEQKLGERLVPSYPFALLLGMMMPVIKAYLLKTQNFSQLFGGNMGFVCL